MLETYPNQEIPLLLAASGVTAGQMALIGMIVAATFLMLLSISRRRREGGPSPRAYARELTGRLREEKAIQSDTAEITLRLQEVAREINAQLDAKFIRLEQCIAEADRRIEHVERSASPAAPRTTLDVTVGEDSTDLRPVPEPPRKDQARERIHAMLDRGMPSPDIARAVGKPLGEVELMAALRKTRPIRPVAAGARSSAR